MNEQTLVLVDGSYYLFRAYHAVRGLSNSKGEPTGAIYGVINMIKKHLSEGGPDYFAIVFDAKGDTFRNEMYSEYKANRPPMPDDLASQIQPLHDIIRAMGIPLLIIDGVEADDVIATLSRQAEQENIKTIVSTGDKDLAQMVNDKIHLINTMNNLYLDPEGVEKKFGIPPDKIIDYLTLMGDSVDNIPGVPKVGPKTAVKWIKEYGSLDEIIKHADEIKGKVGENLREFLPNIPLTRELVTLKYDVELNFSPHELILDDEDTASLKQAFRYWEFKTWLAQLNDDEPIEQASLEVSESGEKNYHIIYSNEELDNWIAKLEQADLISIDTETTSLNYMEAEIVGLSFAVTLNEAAYLPLAHDYAGAPIQLDRDSVLAKLKPLLEDKARCKIGQNLKYDKEVLANYGIELNGIQHD
ncbi:MAG: 5'-3' exonuclease H3TH domain-containing protein, partial [Pseudomonadota bacterium]